MNKDIAIHIDHVSKHFILYQDKKQTIKERFISRNKNKKIKQVLDNITLDIYKGETVGLVGVNGCGKSTLLKMISKIMYPNHGTIKTYGKIVSLIELGAGFHTDFSGYENIYFNASIFGLNKKEIDKRLNDIINFSELGSAINEPVRTYSSGMYMRLAFSIAINIDADILLIDEILAVGDYAFQNKCLEKINQLKNEGKTIVIVSHSNDLIKQLCQRAIWIDNGKIMLDQESSKVIEKYSTYK